MPFSLNLVHQQQQLENDCWATCLAIICQFRGTALTRQQILAGAPAHIPGYQIDGMATLAEANRCIKRLTNSNITFELLAKPQLTREEFLQYINQQRVVMLSMMNHCWLVSGYNDTHLLIHNVAKKDGPQAMTADDIKKQVTDCVVLNLPVIAPAAAAAQ